MSRTHLAYAVIWTAAVLAWLLALRHALKDRG